MISSKFVRLASAKIFLVPRQTSHGKKAECKKIPTESYDSKDN